MRRLRSYLPTMAIRRVGTIKAVGDCIAWAWGIGLAAVVRWDLVLVGHHVSRILWLVGVAALGQVLIGYAVGLYRNHWIYGSFEEIAIVTATAVATLLLLLAVSELLGKTAPPIPISLGATSAAVTGMVALRYLWRFEDQRRRRPRDAGQRVLVFGAGEGAELLLNSLLRNPNSDYVPVAVLDDDPGKANLRLRGVRVVGGRDQIGAAAKAFGATTVVLAIPSAGSTLVRSIRDITAAEDLELRVLPPTTELLGGPPSEGDLRTPTITDLLGRYPVDIDLRAAATYVRGRKVLVTGAGGSIGSELCRQLTKFDPAHLIMVDRDESALHDVQLSLDGRGMLDSNDLVLLDIRDRDAVSQLMRQRRPDVVFHAAALKHLALLEQHPAEAVKSNVLGTLDLLETALESGVETFVNVSTDKAANPASILGYSKRTTERLTAQAAMLSFGGRYLSVRFGNVLASRGSVIPAFRAQIERGGPLCITDPDVTRYFMTIEEAVQLVIQAGVTGPAGSVMVLEMGDPVRIADVAKMMVLESGRKIDIVYSGLRPGEKLHEDLFGSDELPRPARHPLLSEVDVPALPFAAARELPTSGGSGALRSALQRVSTEMPLDFDPGVINLDAAEGHDEAPTSV
jgi:FlaA1/EpsC-like NDP-sugar epimerase